MSVFPDNSYKTAPKLTIGGVAMVLGSPLGWSRVEGPYSSKPGFIVDNVTDAELQKLTGAQDIAWDWTIDGKSEAGTWGGVYLGTRRQVDPWMVSWELFDVRHRFSENRVFAQFNISREIAIRASASSGSPVANFDTVAARRYLPQSLRKGTQFAPSITGGGKPWTALQALEWVLEDSWTDKNALPAPTVFRDSKLFDNEYTLQDMRFAGDPWPIVVNTLLQLSNAGLDVTEKGEFRLFAKNESPMTLDDGSHEGGGWLDVLDMSRVTPKKIIARVPREYEVRLDFTYPAAALTKDAQLHQLENVVQLPDPITIGGVAKLPGEWVNINDAIVAWQGGWAAGFGDLSQTDMEKGLLGVMLTHKFCSAPTTAQGIDPVSAMRINALRRSWRKVFRMPRALLDAISDWTPQRVGIVDDTTKHRQMSPVWMDHSLVSSGKVEYSKGTATKSIGVNIKHPDNAFVSMNAGNVAPAFLRVVDKELGVIAVDFYPDLEGGVLTYLRTQLDDEITLIAGGAILAGVPEAISFKSSHKMSTVITVRPRVPMGKAQTFYGIGFEASDFGLTSSGDVPRLEFTYHGEPARFAWPFGNPGVPIQDQGGEFVFNHQNGYGAPANADILHAVLRGEASRVAATFFDRAVGRHTVAGWRPKKHKLDGYASSIDSVFYPPDGANGGMIETSVNIVERVEAPQLRTLLPRDARSRIYGSLSDQVGGGI